METPNIKVDIELGEGLKAFLSVVKALDKALSGLSTETQKPSNGAGDTETEPSENKITPEDSNWMTEQLSSVRKMLDEAGFKTCPLVPVGVRRLIERLDDVYAQQEVDAHEIMRLNGLLSERLPDPECRQDPNGNVMILLGAYKGAHQQPRVLVCDVSGAQRHDFPLDAWTSWQTVERTG